MRYHEHILFTCITVLSRLVVKGQWVCKIWIGGTNNKLLGGPRQIRKTQYRRKRAKGSFWPRTKPEWTYSRSASRSSCSSMYKCIQISCSCSLERKDWDVVSYGMIHCSHIFCCLSILLFMHNLFLMSNCCFLCTLKINHDSHEFILEFGTVANSGAAPPP
jgi:hypothetical protein